MAQDYDKILKENAEELIKSLARVVLKIDYSKLEEIPDDNQYTIEKRPDFLKIVREENPLDNSILQIEIQSTDPHSMIRRMLVYYGFLYHDYGLPVKQYVLYIGKKGQASMPTSLKHENLNFKFQLINVGDLDYEDFLFSKRPEDVVIAILCDYKKEKPELIIETILRRLKLLSIDELALGKYVRQLEVLAKLRNLQALTIKKIETMPLVYDLKTDIRYNQGIEKGIEEGIEKGIEKKTIQFVTKLIEAKLMPLEQIAEFVEVDLKVVEKINEKLKKL